VSDLPPTAAPLFAAHPRNFEENRYVYPVLSRRAGGISIGINLNVDKACNFDCIYCQVDRTRPGLKGPVVVGDLVAELEQMVELVTTGRIFQVERFRDTPAELRRLNDFAFSGDGEPTTCPNFPEVVAACAEVRRRHRLDDVKLVLITNATVFQRPKVRQALEILDANNGETWAKLDAGTDPYYHLVDRTRISLARILENITAAARVRPIVIQALFMRIHGDAPPPAEQEAFCQRLQEIVAAGGQIKLVQIHTVARAPAENWVAPLGNAEVDALVDLVRHRTGLAVAGYYGSPVATPQ
jgi:wyosine [tRNA(Phe)-imidazoG37] synthetase (radical SAM superfamily)